MYSLYDHQVEHLKKDSEHTHQRGIHFIPTRGGKTNVMSDLCLKSFNHDNQDIEICIIVSPRRALNEQLLKDVMDYNVNFLQKDNKIGWLIWHSDEKDNADHSIGNGKYLNYNITLSNDRLQQKVNKNRKIIIVSTLDSISKLLENLQSCKINYIMFDEAHNLVSNEFEDLVSSNLLSNIEKVRFFTATGKTSNANVSMDNPNVFGNIIHKTTPNYLLSQQIIVPIHLYGLQVNWIDKTKTLVSEIANETWFKILEDSIEEHKKWNQSENPNLEYNSIVVACPNCEFINKYQNDTIYGHRVFGMISDDRIGSKKSQNNLEEFTKYKGNKVLLHYDMVGEGITVKELSCAIALRALNEIKIVQFCGRICGKSENKTKGQVIIPCIDSLESSCNTKNFINIIKDLKKEDYNPFVMHHLVNTDQSRDDKDKENPLDDKVSQEQKLTDELLNLMPEDQFLSIIEVDKLKFTNLSLLHKKWVNYARYGRDYSLIQDKDFIDTPEKLCEEMISNLPLELFKDPDKTFLDPCCGDGTFLWVLFTKLMNGLIEKIPDEKERMEHILSKQLYGIDINNHAITEINNFLKKMFGTNIIWNIFCADTLTRKFNMKFDVVVGNPPYQKSHTDGGSKQDLYPDFVLKALSLTDQYVLMITPHRWMFKPTLFSFKNYMINSSGLKKMIKFSDTDKVFGKDVTVKGGPSYFLCEKGYIGEVFFTENNTTFTMDLANGGSTRFISPYLIKIINKISKKTDMSNIVKFNTSINTTDSRFSDSGDIELLLSRGRVTKIPLELAKKYGHDLLFWKVIFPRCGNNLPDKAKIISPNITSSKSLRYILCSSELEAENMLSWFKTTLIRFLPLLNQQTHEVNGATYKGVPACPDLSKTWTDQDVVDLFGITNEENEWMKKCIEEFDIDEC